MYVDKFLTRYLTFQLLFLARTDWLLKEVSEVKGQGNVDFFVSPLWRTRRYGRQLGNFAPAGTGKQK